jgi:hypothetical protein
MKKSLFYSILALSTASIITGCGGGGDSTPLVNSDINTTSADKINLSGDFGENYALYKAPWYKKILTKAYANSFGSIKKAVAIPLDGTMPIFEKIKDLTIDEDGSFSVDLDKKFTFSEEGETQTVNLNWLILIEKSDGSISFLSIPNDDLSESLVSLPISQAKSNLSLGVVSNSADEGRSSLKLNELTQKTNYSIDELNSLATADDVIKAIVNSYRNNYGKDEDEYIDLRLTVVAEGDFNQIGSSYSKAENYRGYSINIYAGPKTVLAQNFSNICNNTKQISLELPEDITFYGDGTYNTLISNGGTLNGTSCGGNGIFQEQTDYDGSVSLNFGGGEQVVKSIIAPKGNLKLKFDNQIVGIYDLSYSLPVKDNKMKLPIPALKLDLDEDSRVKGFYLKWYLAGEEISSSISKEILKDLSLYTQANSGLAISCKDAIFDKDGNLKSYIAIKDCQENGSAPTDRYYKPTDTTKKELESVYVRYETPGGEIRFSYDK